MQGKKKPKGRAMNARKRKGAERYKKNKEKCNNVDGNSLGGGNLDVGRKEN